MAGMCDNRSGQKYKNRNVVDGFIISLTTTLCVGNHLPYDQCHEDPYRYHIHFHPFDVYYQCLWNEFQISAGIQLALGLSCALGLDDLTGCHSGNLFQTQRVVVRRIIKPSTAFRFLYF